MIGKGRRMKALVYHGPGDMRLLDRPVPEPGPGEVLVRMRRVAVCGSDLGAYRLPEASDRWAPPIVLGHEFSGEIAKNGPGCGKFREGRRVTANPILYCGDCFFCRKGFINLCSRRASLGTSIGGARTDGAMQEYFTIRESAVIALDDTLTLEQGALLEPLAVCYCAARAGAALPPGAAAVVMGAGPIGLMIVKFLKAMGVSVFVSDIQDARLECARNYGADHAINVGASSLKDAVLGATGGVGADKVVICAGNPGAIPDAFGLVRNGGDIVLVALAHYRVEIDPMQLVARGVSLIGSYMFTTEQRDVMRMVAEKEIFVDDIVTATVPLAESESLFPRLASPDCAEVKVLITA